MPQEIISKFKKKYGKKRGKSIFYATANKQGRNPETFKKKKKKKPNVRKALHSAIKKGY